MNRKQWKLPRTRCALALLALAALHGCGGFAVDDGILPLPTIHFVFPTPDMYGLAYEQVELVASNGKPIYGWFVPADNPRATVVIDHGALFNRAIEAPHIALFHELRCHVMIVDYQGFGESAALARLDTILDDANVGLEYARARSAGSTDRIVIFGISMGTLPALAQAADNAPDVVGVILEGVVQQDVLAGFGYQLLGVPPSPEAFTRIPDELIPQKNVPRINMPKLFVQSREDELTPFVGAERLNELASEPKQLVAVTGGHGLSVYTDPTYADKIRAFLDDVAPMQTP